MPHGLKSVETIYQRVQAALTQDSFLVRLGWGSGLDSISPNLCKQQPRPIKTRKLIDTRFPMGWLRVEYQASAKGKVQS